MAIETKDVINLINSSNEAHNLEFKEAKGQFDSTKLYKYCAALANERGGLIVLGVSDKAPRNIVGTAAFQDTQDVIRKILQKLQIRVNASTHIIDEKRVLVFEVSSRPAGSAVHLDGAYWMRNGEDLVPMSQDQLRKIHAENNEDWLEAECLSVTTDELSEFIDIQNAIHLLKLPTATSQESAIQRLISEGLIKEKSGSFFITRMCAILFAKDLNAFPIEISRCAIRFFLYEGKNKFITKLERTFKAGYAICFEEIVNYINDTAPLNRVLQDSLRRDEKMFPIRAIRELVGNAMTHQDFTLSGLGTLIEMYSDRLELSNPGVPVIESDRFIDMHKSRNEQLAQKMRKIGICEEKGSGIDIVVLSAETHMLPAPDFIKSELTTTAILFSHQDFDDMSKKERIRACYQHCVLLCATRQPLMTNRSLRERFKLSESKTSQISQIISATVEAGLIKREESETNSSKLAKYLPWWA
jgi:ATP-dependent DNA helicase RecG